jgi:hypothetical protein
VWGCTVLNSYLFTLPWITQVKEAFMRITALYIRVLAFTLLINKQLKITEQAYIFTKYARLIAWRLTWFTIESPPQHQRVAYAATQCNTTTTYYTVHNRTILPRSITIICVLNSYLTGAGVVPNLAATAAAPLCAHPLRRCLTVLTTTTLPCSN